MKVARIIIFLFALMGLCANWIATDVPWYVIDTNGTHSAPILQDQLNRLGLSNRKAKIPGEIQTGQTIIWSPIPFSPDKTDLGNRYLPPMSVSNYLRGQAIHYLGTDRLGRDVSSVMIRGCRLSLYIALLSMLIAGSLGAVIGGLSGIFGNEFKLLRNQLLYALLFVPYILFLLYHGSWLVTTILLAVLFVLCSRFRGSKNLTIPLDAFVLRMIEVFDSIPLLLILLATSSVILHPSITQLSILIGLLSWPRYARYARAEVLKIRGREYILAAELSGESKKQVAVTYILPEVLPVLVVVFVFGLASTILLESTLSFLGIGTPVEQISWGSLLAQSRQSLKSWWLAFFPGLAIFTLVFCLNRLAANRQSTALK